VPRRKARPENSVPAVKAVMKVAVAPGLLLHPTTCHAPADALLLQQSVQAIVSLACLKVRLTALKPLQPPTLHQPLMRG